MNPKTLVKWSNRIGIFAIIALIYWVFVFIIIQVFGLRIFRHNLSEIFIFSVLGILAVMAGCLMLNIMLNLTQIAKTYYHCFSSRISDIGRAIIFWELCQ